MDAYTRFVADVLALAAASAEEADGAGLKARLEAVDAKADPSNAMLDLRYTLGTTNDSYLRNGIATLAIARPNGGGGDALASTALYGPRSMAQVREGVVEAMRQRREANQLRAPRVVQSVAEKLALYLQVAEFRDLPFEEASGTARDGDWAEARLCEAGARSGDPTWLQDFGAILQTFRGALNAAAGENDMCDKLLGIVTDLMRKHGEQIRQLNADTQQQNEEWVKTLRQELEDAQSTTPPPPPPPPPPPVPPPPPPPVPQVQTPPDATPVPQMPQGRLVLLGRKLVGAGAAILGTMRSYVQPSPLSLEPSSFWPPSWGRAGQAPASSVDAAEAIVENVVKYPPTQTKTLPLGETEEQQVAAFAETLGEAVSYVGEMYARSSAIPIDTRSSVRYGCNLMAAQKMLQALRNKESRRLNVEIDTLGVPADVRQYNLPSVAVPTDRRGDMVTFFSPMVGGNDPTRINVARILIESLVEGGQVQVGSAQSDPVRLLALHSIDNYAVHKPSAQLALEYEDNPAVVADQLNRLHRFPPQAVWGLDEATGALRCPLEPWMRGLPLLELQLGGQQGRLSLLDSLLLAAVLRNPDEARALLRGRKPIEVTILNQAAAPQKIDDLRALAERGVNEAAQLAADLADDRVRRDGQLAGGGRATTTADLLDLLRINEPLEPRTEVVRQERPLALSETSTTRRIATAVDVLTVANVAVVATGIAVTSAYALGAIGNTGLSTPFGFVTYYQFARWLAVKYGWAPPIPTNPAAGPLEFLSPYESFCLAGGLVGEQGPLEEEPDDPVGGTAYAQPDTDALDLADRKLRAAIGATPMPAPAPAPAAAVGADRRVAQVGALHAVERAIVDVPAAPHEPSARKAVRWIPSTPLEAEVAVVRHLSARCAAIANASAGGPEEVAALRVAAAGLKLRALERLAALRRSGAAATPTEPRGDDTVLLTAPCVRIGQRIAFAVDPTPTRVKRARGVHASAMAAEVASGGGADWRSATREVRQRVSATGATPVLFVPPPLGAEAWAVPPPLPTGVYGERESVTGVAPAQGPADLYTLHSFAHLLDTGDAGRRELLLTAAEFDALLKSEGGVLDRPGAVSATERRNALWAEVLRELAVSNDRLLTFLRTVAGLIGEEVAGLVVQDPQAEERQKALEQQELAVTQRISDAYTRLVEIVCSKLADRSTLALSRSQQGQFVVIDQDAKEQLQELSRGDTGKNFFNASVTLRNLAQANEAATTVHLGDLLRTINGVASELKSSLLGALVDEGGVASELNALTLPRNSATLLLRADVVAALHAAFDRVTQECADLRRSITLWELCECAPTLSLRFAEVVAHMLSASRVRTGTASVGAAVQIPKSLIATNAITARVSFQRLRHAIIAHLQVVPRAPALPPLPAASTTESTAAYRESLRKARTDTLAQAATAARVVAPRSAWGGNAYGA